MKRSLYIIRHGQTDLNKMGIVQGRGVNSPLNDHGILQAKAFYESYRHIPFDHVITSTLLRTHQTVEAFIQDGIPWVQHAGLDEISWGIYEGKHQDEEIAAGFNKLVESWIGGDLDVCVDEGETPNQMKIRQQTAIKDILEITEGDKNVLICMHGRAMRMLLCLLTNQSYSLMDTFPHTNTALYKVDYNEGDFDIDIFYNIDHLENLEE
ncbi:histidine phosphatase family protein [Albibacterium sp.]|uniref:histidine phosphatase family protein n=1 Tax=Albibacterium sp. TaxID=2952885 RepID=UPI002CBBC938|nr:histidine phosphatase family protein [Albibacterium sp.]HUH18239.1 histidine phosphatase family protein [Albibacterium sp.]